ncbi:MAG: hypothetical protein ACRDTF_10145 [Pseudonocardiaceae bacterium]
MKSSPAMLEELTDAWRGLQSAAETAQDTVDLETRRVFSYEAWEGDTADAHRSKLTGDIGQFAGLARTMAQALEEVAGTLRFNQDALERERAGLAGIPVTENDDSLTFRPEDDEQARRINEAIAAARDFRERVDHVLVLKKAVFETAEADLRDISETWKPRTVRVLDLNIFQGGKGNKPWPMDDAPKGVDHGDIDELGQLILDNRADVATLQEAFKGDMERLEQWLEDETGEEWDMHFAAASHNTQWDDAVGVEGAYNRPFGNAILVRRGGDIASSEELPEVVLREDGIISGPEGRSMEGTSIELTDD